jgi:hypothetical protein
MGEEDALDSRPDGSHLPEEGQIFLYRALGTGDDDAEGSRAQSLEGVGVSVRILNGETGSVERKADLAAYRDEASNYQDTAHSVLQGDEFG